MKQIKCNNRTMEAVNNVFGCIWMKLSFMPEHLQFLDHKM